MTKQKKTAKPAAVATKKAAAPAAAAAVPGTIHVTKAQQKYEGARAAWYAALLQHDGKAADDFVAACTKRPPALPKSGKAEDPRGWLRWFVRGRVAKLA